jgi:arylsulfatase A-like enzyme
MWLAGGAVKGGTIYGATDDFGFKAIEKPVHVHDIHATILYLMGIDHTKLTYRYSGRDFRLTDVDGQVLKGILA